VIANRPESMCDEATRKTVKAVIGIENAAMNTMLTPILHVYDRADGIATPRT
jgi:hypothetical protein